MYIYNLKVKAFINTKIYVAREICSRTFSSYKYVEFHKIDEYL